MDEKEKEEIEIKDEVKEEEVVGDTRTPSEEVPELNTESVPTPQDVEQAEPEPASESNPVQSRTFDQDQVNAMMGKARAEGRASALKELYARYGVNNDDELNGIFGRGQSYDIINDQYNNEVMRSKSLSAENALLKSGISEGRWEDARAILGAKGLEVNSENILAELETHPEWKATPTTNDTVPFNPEPQELPSTIKKLGLDKQEEDKKQMTEEEELKHYFGV